MLSQLLKLKKKNFPTIQMDRRRVMTSNNILRSPMNDMSGYYVCKQQKKKKENPTTTRPGYQIRRSDVFNVTRRPVLDLQGLTLNVAGLFFSTKKCPTHAHAYPIPIPLKTTLPASPSVNLRALNSLLKRTSSRASR
jgi:hypothetical protein